MSDFINRRKSLRWSGAILTVVALGMGSLLTVAAPVRADNTIPAQGAPSSGKTAMSAWDPIAKAPVALLASPAYQLPTQIYSPHFAVLPDGRFAIPAGKQVTLGNLPVNLALSPNHQWVAVSNSGAGNQSIMILNATTGAVVQTIPMKTLYNGLVFSPDSQTLYVAGGGTNEVFVFQQQKGTFTQTGSIPVSGYPTALALSPDGNTLYVTDNLGNDLTAVHLQSGQGISQQTVQVGEDPFAVAVSSNGQQIYVSNWKSSSLSVVNAATLQISKTIPLWDEAVLDAANVGTLPGNLVLSPDGKTAYVVEADNDDMAVVDLQSGKVTQWVNVEPYPHAPFGINPNAIALSPNGRRLYVSEGMLNAVGVYSLVEQRWLGQIPVGWYPMGVLVNPITGDLFVINSNGLGSGPNVQQQWVGGMIDGTLSVIARPSRADLVQDTQTVVQATVRVLPQPLNSVIPLIPGKGPIHHVVLIVRENKTYDEEFGDIKAGNGDPALTLYPAKITPNNHALAQDFGLFNNYYVDGEVTAQGHQWVAGAGPTDYVQRTWAAYYSNRGRTWDAGVPGTPANTDTYGWEQNVYSDLWAGSLPVTYPKLGYLFNDALCAHLSFLDYGEFVEHDPTTGNVLSVLKPHLQANYPGWNLHIPDTQRAAIFMDNLKKGVFPQFSYVYLMDDHTAGTEPGFPNPNAEVANNDEATGEIVNAISHSKYWKSTAIFVLEDDAQSGGDHVDAHRSILMVASPYARRNVVLNSHYDQMSVLKTIELMLGMPSLTVNDTFATPLWSAFTNKPNFAPYVLQKENVPYQFTANVMNTVKTVDAALSANHPMSQIEQASGAVQRKVLTDYYKNWKKAQG